MVDKLAESTWVGFTKELVKKWKLDPKLKLDDAVLVKTLAAYDKADKSKPEPHLKALDELIKQIPELVKTLTKRKKELGDKPFGDAKDKLYEFLQEAESQHKATTAKAAQAKAAEAKGKGEDDEKEEEETPALLTSKMIPLLRELKKGEAVMPFLMALAGKETVVLVSRRAISPARGKLLKEQMAQPTGLKFIRGECQYENSALTFVVQSPGAALAKRLRQALLDQTSMRWKVRVRGEDGVVEEDGDEEDETRKPATAHQLAYTQRLLKLRDRYQNALREQHPKAVQFKELMDQANAKANEQQDHAGAIKVLEVLDKALDEPARTQADGVNPGGAFKARLTAMLPRMKEIIAVGGASATDIKLKASEAGVFATKKNFDQAHRLLDEVAKLLGSSGTGAAPTGTQTAGQSVFSKVAFEKVHLDWDSGKKTIEGRLAQLNQAILADADVPEAATAAAKLSKVLGRFNEGLGDALDAMRNMEPGAQRKAAAEKAAAIAGRYLNYLASDVLVSHVDENPFDIEIAARELLSQPLNELQQKLATLTA